eukprot:TRINITY_DN3419_c0_g2_i8.p1 TRINITY_DN3419_c0_g2~~TRINITY_DN3419_c0_g2_i8.p1  ORF type:complete len:220 (-),score=-11.64 TRINITY_DN3419_c0_g2_i8:821-1480(-)
MMLISKNFVIQIQIQLLHYISKQFKINKIYTSNIHNKVFQGIFSWCYQINLPSQLCQNQSKTFDILMSGVFYGFIFYCDLMQITFYYLIVRGAMRLPTIFLFIILSHYMTNYLRCLLLLFLQVEQFLSLLLMHMWNIQQDNCNIIIIKMICLVIRIIVQQIGILYLKANLDTTQTTIEIIGWEVLLLKIKLIYKKFQFDHITIKIVTFVTVKMSLERIR